MTQEVRGAAGWNSWLELVAAGSSSSLFLAAESSSFEIDLKSLVKSLEI